MNEQRPENGTDPSPLRSQEAFDAYCGQVQSRLAEAAGRRIQFLRGAHDRLTRLLQAARAIEDNSLYNELWSYRAAVRELTDAASQLAGKPPAAWPTLVPPAKPIPLPNTADHMVRSVHAPDLVPRTVPQQAPVHTSNATSSQTPLPAARVETEAAPRLPRHPMRPLIDIEAEAIQMRGDLRDWSSHYPLRRPGGELNVPNALRLRAMACRQRRLEEEAGDTEVAEVTELHRDIVRLLDTARDQEYTVALDYGLDPRPTAYQWNELSDRHEETARAQEAFEWWLEHRPLLTVADVQPLAESVAAIQQRFNRLLFRIGSRDPFQQQLFDDLRAWAKESQCYLFSLRPKVPIAELVEKSALLERAWEQARIPVIASAARQQTVDALSAMVNEPDFGTDPARDEARTRAALLRCREAGVPASDRRVRDALLPWAVFLEGDERFRETAREIHLEWERREEAGQPEGDLWGETAEPTRAELEAVVAVTYGKRCLILGGACSEQSRSRIEKALQLEELVWPCSKPSDELSEFETEIHHSDIVALLTRFSRKEWQKAAGICARDGKRFIQIASNCSVAQMVHHLYTQLSPQQVEGRGQAV